VFESVPIFIVFDSTLNAFSTLFSILFIATFFICIFFGFYYNDNNFIINIDIAIHIIIVILI
jgi:hypothetical protein